MRQHRAPRKEKKRTLNSHSIASKIILPNETEIRHSHITKSETVHHWSTCNTSDAKESSSGSREMTYDVN